MVGCDAVRLRRALLAVTAVVYISRQNISTVKQHCASAQPTKQQSNHQRLMVSESWPLANRGHVNVGSAATDPGVQ